MFCVAQDSALNFSVQFSLFNLLLLHFPQLFIVTVVIVANNLIASSIIRLCCCIFQFHFNFVIFCRMISKLIPTLSNSTRWVNICLLSFARLLLAWQRPTRATTTSLLQGLRSHRIQPIVSVIFLRSSIATNTLVFWCTKDLLLPAINSSGEVLYWFHSVYVCHFSNNKSFDVFSFVHLILAFN